MEFRTVIASLCVLGLYGCEHNQVREILVPVPVVVKIDKPERPKLLSDSSSSVEERVRAAKMDLEVMKKYTSDLETLIIEHDKTIPTMPPGITLIRE